MKRQVGLKSLSGYRKYARWWLKGVEVRKGRRYFGGLLQVEAFELTSQKHSNTFLLSDTEFFDIHIECLLSFFSIQSLLRKPLTLA